MISESSTASLPLAELARASSPARRSRPFRSRFLLALLIPLGAALLLLQWPQHSGTEICTSCGLRRDLFDLRTRFSSFALHRIERTSPTMVSAALEGSGARTAHEHRWMEGAPSHPGVHETTASSGLADVADAPRVASFLRDVARFADAPSLERWRELLLDPTYGSVADASLHFMRFPEEGYADRAAFSRWWKPSQFALWNRLREETEAD